MHIGNLVFFQRFNMREDLVSQRQKYSTTTVHPPAIPSAPLWQAPRPCCHQCLPWPPCRLLLVQTSRLTCASPPNPPFRPCCRSERRTSSPSLGFCTPSLPRNISTSSRTASCIRPYWFPALKTSYPFSGHRIWVETRCRRSQRGCCSPWSTGSDTSRHLRHSLPETR